MNEFTVVAIALVALWIGAIVSSGQIAASRGHAPAAWYLAAILFGPVAVLFALVAPYTPERLAQAIVAADRGNEGSAAPHDSSDQDSGSGRAGPRWQVQTSSDRRVRMRSTATLARVERTLVIATPEGVVRLPVDDLSTRVGPTALLLSDGRSLHLTLVPLDGQDPPHEASSLGLAYPQWSRPVPPAEED